MTEIEAVTTAVVEANFDYTFVRVHTTDGLYGTGECFPAPGLVPMVGELGRLLLGQDARRPVPLWRRMLAAVSGSGSAVAAGIAYNAISGIEAALWDLNGKRLGEPVVNLLGGRLRDTVDVYADLHGGTELHSITPLMEYRKPFWLSESGVTEIGNFYWDAAEAGATTSVDEIVDRCRAAVTDGFRHLKLDLDVFGSERETTRRTASSSDLAWMRDMALAVRETVGSSVQVAFDCHWRFDVLTALAVADAVAPARPMWLEDPVPPHPPAMAAVAAGSKVPVATGENTYLLEGFSALTDVGAAHILTPDVQKAGGVAESLRIGELAARKFLGVAPHCIASPFGLMAAAHVCAALPNHLCLEFHGADLPFWNELVQSDRPLVMDGCVRVTDAPGFGLELDVDIVRRYSRPGQPVFEQSGN